MATIIGHPDPPQDSKSDLERDLARRSTAHMQADIDRRECLPPYWFTPNHMRGFDLLAARHFWIWLNHAV
jgi:hypothetical protein